MASLGSTLGPSTERGWSLTLFPGAGEGGGSWSSGNGRMLGTRPEGPAANPERSAREAAQRAASKIRRYCAHNRLNRLGTLTYAGDGNHDPAALRLDLGEFFRALRAGLGGKPLPYLWVPEWHGGGHGLHAHIAVGRYVQRSVLADSWGRGFVHIKLLGDLPVGSGKLAEARKAAGYLSKYVSKDIGQERTRGGPALHRYEVAQGFQPTSVRLHGRHLGDVLDEATAVMGGRPAQVWQSQIADGWLGPPSVWASWD